MADNSIMTNISAVEEYGRNLSDVNEQMVEMFCKMNEQTKYLSSYWSDDMYERFAEDFDQDIMKSIQEISFKLDTFAHYVDKMCELNRMTQDQKYY